MDELGETIKRRRNELGMSQAELAAACGVHLRQIRRYESNEQQPALGVAARLATALGITIGELAGEAAPGPRLDGTWWASWQTFIDGREIVTSQPVALKQFGTTVQIEALELAPEMEHGGDYMWRGEFRVWDRQVLMGWYIATQENVRSKGTMFFVLHTQGDRAEGRWAGTSYDGPIVTGWSALAHSREEVLATMNRLTHSDPKERAA